MKKVEDFWRLYNNVLVPSKLKVGCTYNLFKKEIQPRWEDPGNAKGARVAIIVKEKKDLDKLWQNLV